MKLQKIINRLQKLHPKEIDLSLDRIKNLCEKLGNPQDKIKAISIVGTNGKQSTINALFAILKESKIKCNVYTSPHIQKINERFVFNNQELNDEELADLLEEVRTTFTTFADIQQFGREPKGVKPQKPEMGFETTSEGLGIRRYIYGQEGRKGEARKYF